MKIKIPKELILNGTDNNGLRHRYGFDKNKNFKSGFIKLMEELEFDSEKIKNKFVRREYKDTEQGEEEIITILNIEDIQDVCWFFENSKYEIDLFFGKNKIILLIRTNQKIKRERRRKMLDELEKRSDWISEKEKKVRAQKIKKKIFTFSK